MSHYGLDTRTRFLELDLGRVNGCFLLSSARSRGRMPWEEKEPNNHHPQPQDRLPPVAVPGHSVGLRSWTLLCKNLLQNLVIEETEEHSWAHVCPARLAAMSTIWAELKQAHHRDLSVVQPFLPSPCSQARNRLSTSPQQCGVRIWFCCALFQPVGASRVSDQQLPSSILVRVWPDEQTAPPQPPRRVLTGTANRALSGVSCYAGIAASLCAFGTPWISACCTALGRSRSDFRMFSSCPKGLIFFAFPSVTAEHRKWSTWKTWKMVSMLIGVNVSQINFLI